MSITPFSLLMFIMAGLLAWVAWQMGKRAGAPGSLPLTLLMIALVEWAVATAFESAVVGIPAKLTASKFQYPGIAFSSVLFLWFGVEFYSQRKLHFRLRYLWLWAIPVITVLMGATNEYHGLMWTHMTPVMPPELNLVEYGHGTWFWVHMVYYYLVIAAASILLIQAALRFRHIYRDQAIVILLAIPIPWVTNVVYIFGLGKPGEDFTVLGLGASSIFFAWSLWKLQLFDLVPVVRDRVIEWMDHSLIVLDRQLRVLDVNTAAVRAIEELQPERTPLAPGELIGRPVSQAFEVFPQLVEHLQKGEEGRFDVQIQTGGCCRHVELQISAIHDPGSGQSGWWAMLSDITALKLAREEALKARDRALQVAAENSVLYEQMRQMALTDPLTGLSTRRHFFNLGALAFDWAVKEHQPLAAMMLDIDRFKQVNDGFGHAVGDRLLELVARTCQESLRKTDIIGRYGGEELVILLPDTSREIAMKIAERLRCKIDSLRHETARGPVGVSVSVGVAVYAGPGDHLEALIDRADQGMYAAKLAGRNQVKFNEFLPEPPAVGAT